MIKYNNGYADYEVHTWDDVKALAYDDCLPIIHKIERMNLVPRAMKHLHYIFDEVDELEDTDINDYICLDLFDAITNPVKYI